MAEQSAVEFVSNRQAIVELLEKACDSALSYIGQHAQAYAQARAKGTWGRQLGLHDQIRYSVEDGVLRVGAEAGFEIAAYVELGTATKYKEPPEWLQNYVAEGENRFGEQGIEKWWYRDELTGEWRPGAAQAPHPYIQPAITEYTEDYRNIVKQELSDAE